MRKPVRKIMEARRVTAKVARRIAVRKGLAPRKPGAGKVRITPINGGAKPKSRIGTALRFTKKGGAFESTPSGNWRKYRGK